MSAIFLFDDGHGNGVDENGGPESAKLMMIHNNIDFDWLATSFLTVCGIASWKHCTIKVKWQSNPNALY